VPVDDAITSEAMAIAGRALSQRRGDLGDGEQDQRLTATVTATARDLAQVSCTDMGAGFSWRVATALGQQITG